MIPSWLSTTARTRAGTGYGRTSAPAANGGRRCTTASCLDDHEFLSWFVPWCRAAVAPGALVAEADRFGAVDVRGVLSSIQVPTVVIGRQEDGPERARHADDAIAGIRGARLIRPPNNPPQSLYWYGRADAILVAVGELIAEIDEEQRSFDRVLATVLFSDIVGSTASAVSLGDRRWRELVEQHHSVVRGLLARYRGCEVDTAGDGFFATFDGPARAVRCGEAIIAGLHDLGLDVRIGVHTGEIETINDKVGRHRRPCRCPDRGVGATSTGSRFVNRQGPHAGSGLTFVDAGEHELKGIPARWRLYSVAN